MPSFHCGSVHLFSGISLEYWCDAGDGGSVLLFHLCYSLYSFWWYREAGDVHWGGDKYCWFCSLLFCIVLCWCVDCSCIQVYIRVSDCCCTTDAVFDIDYLPIPYHSAVCRLIRWVMIPFDTSDFWFGDGRYFWSPYPITGIFVLMMSIVVRRYLPFCGHCYCCRYSLVADTVEIVPVRCIGDTDAMRYYIYLMGYHSFCSDERKCVDTLIILISVMHWAVGACCIYWWHFLFIYCWYWLHCSGAFL